MSINYRKTIFDGFHLKVSFGPNKGKKGSRSSQPNAQTYRLMLNSVTGSIGADFDPHEAKSLVRSLRMAATSIKLHAGLKGQIR
jgi:hypothetical protein